ncbi:hypothetical protein [Microcoleus sp. herbarium2]|uniref:hypothetical protein n=1 Tax=Microcoleus sp. herbarium2 TaxID=3055433 RepID=UPI002FD551A7
MTRKKQAQDLKDIPALQILREGTGRAPSGLAKQIPDRTRAKTLTRQAISNWERGLDVPDLTIPQVKTLRASPIAFKREKGLVCNPNPSRLKSSTIFALIWG